MRGAERTFAEIAGLLAASRRSTPCSTTTSGHRRLRRPRGPHLPPAAARRRPALLSLPAAASSPGAVERLPVRRATTRSSRAAAPSPTGIRPGPRALHVCYCHSPFRYAWFEQRPGARRVPAPRPAAAAPDAEADPRLGPQASSPGHPLRRQLGASPRQRIEEIYGVESEIVHPPVEVERFAIAEPEDYVLFVGQIVPPQAGRGGDRGSPAGGPPDQGRRRWARPSAPPRAAPRDGRSSSSAASAMIALPISMLAAWRSSVPNVEEFGIAAVEAQAAGRPVVAVARGGATETVIDGRDRGPGRR